MTEPSPQNKESQERLREQSELTTEQLSRASEMMKQDVNAPYTRAMANADIANPSLEDKEGLTFMQSEIINIMTKIVKKHPKANLSKLTPENLAENARKLGVLNKDRNSETLALNKLNEINQNKSSQTYRELQVNWSEWVNEAESAKEGFGKKYLRRLKEKPVETIIYTAAGAAGIYLGLKALGWLFNKGKEKVSSKIKEKASSIFGTGNVLGMLGLGALGVYMGRHSLENWIYTTFGVRFGAKKTKEMLDQIQKGKIPPELADLQKKAEAAKAEGGIAGMLQKAKDRLTPTKEDKEVSERYEEYGNFIKSKNPELKVNAMLFSEIGGEDYETFLSESESSIERIISLVEIGIGMKEEGVDKTEKAKEFLVEHGAPKLISFFQEMLKNENHEDFKGKSINQVMELILNNPQKYIDEEAVAEANTKNEHLEELKKMMKMDNIGKLLSGDTEFASTFFKHATLAGVTFAIDKAQNGVVWVIGSGVDALMWESEVVYKTIQKIADIGMESDNGWLLGAGVYLQVGAYTAAIGAPLGTAVGFGKSMIRNPLGIGSAAIRGGVGGYKGLKAGLFMPAKFTLGTMWDIAGGNFHPIQDFQRAVDQQRFIFEDLSVGKIGQMGKWKTLTQKIASGEVELTDDLIRRLDTYEKIAAERAVEMNKAYRESKVLGKKSYSRKAGSYNRMSKEIEKILELANADRSGIDPIKWRTTMTRVAKEYGIDNNKFLSNIDGMKGTPKAARIRIGSLLLFNPEHSFSKLIASNPKKAAELFKLFDTNQEILEAIVKNPNLINDFRILNAIENLDGKTSAKFVELFVERAAIWKGMGRRELKVLNANPEIIRSYTRLTESLQSPQRSVQWIMEAAARREGMSLVEFRKTDEGKKALDFAKRSLDRIGAQNQLLKKIMLTPNTRQAQFIYRHIDDLDILFENTAVGQKAVDHFLAIDSQVLKIMQKEKALGQLSEHFKNFSTKQGEIVEMVKLYEGKLGIKGKMARQLGKMKAGLYDKIGESTEEIAKKGKEAVRRFRGVRVTASHIDELGKIKDFKQVEKLLSNQGVEVEKWAIRAIAKTDNLDEIKVILRKATQQSGQYVRFVRGAGAVAKAIRILKPVSAVTFGAAAFIGAGFDFYSAANTDNKKKQSLYLQKGGISAVAGTAEVATMVVAGAASTSAAVVGFAAAPYVYMSDTAYESALEHETEPKEWAQNYDYGTLMHHWASTGKKYSAGDSYRAVFTFATRDSIIAEHEEIKGNIVKALILTEGIRFEREDEYRAKYMEVVHDFQGSSDYSKAKGRLHESRLFATAINEREKLKKQGVEHFQLGKIDLMADEFEFEKMGIDQMIALRVNWEVFNKKESVHPLLAQKFEDMSDGELVDYYWQLNKYINQNQETITDNETYFRDQVESYLLYNRKIEANKACEAKWARAIQNEMRLAGELPKDPVKLKQLEEKAIQKVMADFDERAVLNVIASIETDQPMHFETVNEKITNNEASYALYQLAKTFGYIGIQNEEELKGFFNEERKGSLGIYWDGEEWFVNEAGWERDDSIGKDLNRHTIEEIIRELRDKPDDRLEHRQDAVTFGMGEIFEYKVMGMADILEKSLGEYGEKHKEEVIEMPLEEELLVS